jgi:hypothetical protein
MKKTSGSIKASVSKTAKNHAIDKNAGDGRIMPKGLTKRAPSIGEKTYGYGGKKRG